MIVTPPALIVLQPGKHLADDLRRQAGRRLVEDQHRRLDDQRAGHGQHLPLSARQRAGPRDGCVGEIGEHRVERGDASAALRLRQDVGGQPQIVGIDSVAKMFSVCGTKARPCRIFSCAGTRGDVGARRASRVPAWIGTSAGDRLDEGRLAGAVRPEDDDQFARRARAKSTPRTIGRSRS